MSRRPQLTIVEVVTRGHGETFAEDWRDRTTSMLEAFAESGVVEWPDNRLAQMRFHDIEDEVTERIFAELWDVIVERFVSVAGEVLARERRR